MDSVKESGFGDARKVAAVPAKPATVRPVETAVEIIDKPKPKYTEEARKLKIEGEVVLKMLFTATEKAQVLEMVRGLGYGLDQNAFEAAQQIRFKPAQRNGEAVDSTAIIHVIFQLAY